MKNEVNRALVAKKKLFSIIALLTLSVGLWAETVAYRYPVYNTADDPTSGIKEWQTGEVEATVVESTTSQVTWDAGWYVVTGEDVQLNYGAICVGDVRLILADGAKLTATGSGDIDNPKNSTPGIQVSDTGNSLTIYAQSMGDQMGQLKATGGSYGAGIGGGYQHPGSNITINGGTITATGGSNGAGIGGGYGGSGSNITINGGVVTATSQGYGAGIGGGDFGFGSNIVINGGIVTATGGDQGAGIGGGYYASGSNITINGGTITATGGSNGAGIGGGKEGDGSNIHISVKWIINADNNNPPTTPINNDGGDLAGSLAGKQYVTAKYDLAGCKAAAIAEIEQLATAVKADIDAASAYPSADAIKLDYKAKIDLVIEAATDAINNEASTEAMVDELRDKAMLQINGRKEEALTAIAKINEFEDAKVQAIADITNARQGIQNENLNNWIDGAIKDIQKGGPDATPGINEIKNQILTVINFFKEGKAEGIEEGKAAGIEEGKAALPTDAQDALGHTVTITKGEKTLTLVNPDKVTYGKQEQAQ